MNKKFALLLLVAGICSSAVTHANNSVSRSGVCQAGVCLLDDFADIKGIDWEVPKLSSNSWITSPGSWRGEHAKNPTFLKYMGIVDAQLNAQSHPLFRKMANCSSLQDATVGGTFKTNSGRRVEVRFFPVPMKEETHFIVEKVIVEYPRMTEQQQKQVVNELTEKWPNAVSPRNSDNSPFVIFVSDTSIVMAQSLSFWRNKGSQQVLQARANDPRCGEKVRLE